ncbi:MULTISPECIES: ATP-binding protein [Cysteiniphilum]|uniref:ATP-binding protein n=1 Tax=Cysteiniphilum TaxID=2056696 RepID=UPI00177AAB79|nr:MULTISPECIES: ATP-binding protein [Cysteiniphilum]
MTQIRKKLPIGDSTISQIRNRNAIYVDKTRHLLQMVNSGRYFFLSRPRRFGKSLTIDCLRHLFMGNKQLFKGTFAESHWDWDTTYPVIHFSFGSSSAFESEETIIEIIHNKITEIAKEHKVIIEGKTIAVRFHNLIWQLKEKHKKQVVLLIDEYDKPILDVITDEPKAIRNREILKGFYSAIKDNDEHLKFVLLTGVTRFSKVSLFSGLNNLTDISLDQRYADICGYTQTELESSFEEYLVGVDKVKLKKWYNGYDFAGNEQQKVYNPYDILLFIDRGYEYRDYWFQTGTPSFLIQLLKQYRYRVPNLENFNVQERFIDSIDVKNLPLEALLFQAGYLTIKEQITIGMQIGYRLGYPNLEVKASFNNCVSVIGTNSHANSVNNDRLSQSLLSDDWQLFHDSVAALYASIPNEWYRNNPIQDYEGFYCTVIYSYLTALGYDVIAEDSTSIGRIDISIVIPNYKVIILELKVANDKDASKEALQQIIDKNYAHKFLNLDLPIYQVGISFDQNTRSVNGFMVELFKR